MRLVLLVLLVVIFICARGWLLNYIKLLTVVTFLAKKNIHPMQDELNECSEFVWNHIFKGWH